VNSGLFAWYFTPNSGCGLGGGAQDLLSFWNKVPFAMSYLLHATFLFSHFMATHLRDAHAAARQRGRPWSAVLTRIDLGFTFVHRKLSRGSQRPSSSLSFWHYLCFPGTNFLACGTQSIMTAAGHPALLNACSFRVSATSLSSILLPASCVADDVWRRRRRPLRGLPWDGSCFPALLIRHVSAALAWQAVAVQKSLAVGSRGGG